MNPYEPNRSPTAKIARRLVQWRAARPVWASFDRAVVSFTFDDFPQSAAHFGASCLEAHGGRGTYYAAAGLVGTRSHLGPMFLREHVTALAARGHEIACHTHDHFDGAQTPLHAALDDIAQNADALACMGAPHPLTSFAYPYGEARVELKRALAKRFVSARGVMPGLNAGRVDVMQLRANPLFGADAGERAEALLRTAVRKRAWLIFFTHDVRPDPSAYGTTPKVLETLVREAAKLGIEIARVGDVAARFAVERAP